MSLPDKAELTQMLAAMLSAKQGELGSRPETAGIAEAVKNSLFCSGDPSGGGATNDQQPDKPVAFVFPSLSLAHEDHLNFNHENPSEAEKSASELLSRSMGFEFLPDTNPNLNEKLSEVSIVLLENISASFAVLVDSRLRAHASFLAKHGVTTAKTEQCAAAELLSQKLQTLLALGNRISVSNLETKFEEVEDAISVDSSDAAAAADTPVSFKAAMKVNIEALNEDNASSTMTIQFESVGSLHVSKALVELKINVENLLARMKREATEVVKQVVEMTNAFFVAPEEPSFHRQDSYLAMPPPEPACNKSLALVSPDIRGRTQDRFIPPISLGHAGDEDSNSDPKGSALSLDQCADIVDDVFGNVDVSLFCKDRPAKKARTSE